MGWTLSEFLDLIEIRGRTWCYVELGASGGLGIPANDGVVFHAILEGKLSIAGLGNGTTQLIPGDVHMILSGRAHCLRTRTNSTVEHLEFLRQDHREIDKPPTFRIGAGPVAAKLLCGKLKSNFPGDLRRTSVPPVLSLRTRMHVESAPLEVDLARDGAVATLTRMAQIWLTLGLRNHEDCPSLFKQSLERDPIAHALQLITSDPAASWTIASLAKQVGISRSHFFSVFTTQIGCTPMEIITEQRMKLAEKLLEHSQLKIAEIGERVGYGSEPAFIRRFKDYFGLTPNLLRRRARLGHDTVSGPPVSSSPEIENSGELF